MSLRNKSLFSTIILIIALVSSAVITTPVYADEGTPPLESPTVILPEEPLTQDSAGNESTPQTPPAATTVSSILAEAPEGTGVIVVNQSGEVLPLAANTAAAVIADGDPQWCPVG